MKAEKPVPVVARFLPSLTKRIDDFRRGVAGGAIRSRSEVVRAAVEEYLKARA